MSRLLADAYYTLRPLIPRRLQVFLRRLRVRAQRRRYSDRWPILEPAGTPPPQWQGWPGGKRFALALSHDVESATGVARCGRLASIEEDLGFCSAFAFVPLRYTTPDSLRIDLANRGFETLAHGLYHDGWDLRNRVTFEQRRGPINEFLANWNTRGFSCPSMLHNLSWLTELNIDYSISTYDTDPFEPQSCQLGRIFPFSVQSPTGGGGFIEMPYTLPQDFTLYALLREPNNDIWRKKLDWIAAKGGMALLNTHPDYMSFDATDRRFDRYPVEFYTSFLNYVRERYGSEVWLARPSEVARFWRDLRPAGAAAAIPPHPELCEACYRIHEDGWVRHYAPQDPSAILTASELSTSKISKRTQGPITGNAIPTQ